MTFAEGRNVNVVAGGIRNMAKFFLAMQVQMLKHSNMTIALPTANGRLHEHFGGSREFTFVQTDPGQRRILNQRAVVPPPHAPGVFPRWVREQGAEVVIAGGIGPRALAIFAQQGITVRAGRPSAPVEELVAAYLEGRLTATPDGCGHHDHDGDHRHDHDDAGEKRVGSE
jgi:predicted Fe-Mo cluster-binding NifX family protein